jgi:(1->4)-alpha-D-glucan 1-alpha-D-glucosylmutase
LIPEPHPRATYRVQLRAEFDLNAAASVSDYLAELGVSHVYTSPYLRAAAGSAHGYDITDPHQVNPELGGETALLHFRQTLAELNLVELVDVVPNHLSIAERDNRWWWDVLAKGLDSRYADYFDIDWSPPESNLCDRVLLPVLGQRYEQLLKEGAIKVVRSGDSLEVAYADHRFPLSAHSVARLIGDAVRGESSEQLSKVPAPQSEIGPRRAHTLDPEAGGDLLPELDPRAAAALDAAATSLNSKPAKLHQLLEQQHYRLVNWRTAADVLGYRRFFDVNTLAGLRIERPEVFADREKLLLSWIEMGSIAGIRVDHIDGLRDPVAYLDRLRAAGPKIWILTEKILGTAEQLPAGWPVSGTTGYEFSRLVGGLFVDSRHEAEMTEQYAAFTGEARDFATIALESKRFVLREVLGGDLNRVTESLARFCAEAPRGADYTRLQLHEAVLELAANLPVYRTYVREVAARAEPSDQAVIEDATRAARHQRPDLDPSLFTLLEDLLLLRLPSESGRDFAMRFQQFTGPVMAKGVEDTAFYRYLRLVSLNEVGDDPGTFGIGPREFHAALLERQRGQPYALNATSTHDSKRSEDVRARIHLLSEVPELWAAAVTRWAAHNERYRHGGFPSRNDEYLLYQTLVGAWPISIERILPALLKSAREAKVNTSWRDPEPAYEEDLHGFAVAVLTDSWFSREMDQLTGELLFPGRVNSLSQSLVKLTAPGVPDIYQGSEVWNHSLVDPDNRRPVDYGRLQQMLAQVDGMSPATILERSDDGLPKLWVTRQALRLRALMPAAFGEQGTYVPLYAAGPKADHAVAYVRGGAVITVIPRLVLGLDAGWAGTTITLPDGSWRNHLTHEALAGGPQPLSGLFEGFPVALLARAA